MPKYVITECVPQVVRYTKVIDAQSRKEALAMAENWSDIDAPEEGPWFEGDIVDEVFHEAHLAQEG